MPQPTRRERTPAVRKKKVKKTTPRGKRPHPKYGTSKLEDRFAKEFLDKLGYTYVRQYEAKDIGRFYDFAVKQENGAVVLLETDGDYFHGHGLTHGIPLIRIWEHDINDNPSNVTKMLLERIGEASRKQDRKNEKSKRHGGKREQKEK